MTHEPAAIAPANMFDWAAGAKRGDTVEYARGSIAHMRDERARLLRADRQAPTPLNEMCDRANDAWDLFESGRVTLTQRRHGEGDYSYCAVRL